MPGRSAVSLNGTQTEGAVRRFQQLFPHVDTDGAEEAYNSILVFELWKALRAIKNGNVYRVPHDKWWAYSLLTVDGLLDDAVKLFGK